MVSNFIIKMEGNKDNKMSNDNTILVAYNKDRNRSEAEFFKVLAKGENDKIIHYNSNPWSNHQNIEEKDPCFIVAVPKQIADSWTKEDMEAAKINFSIYDPKKKQNRHRRQGHTWALYITTNKEIEYQKFSKAVIDLFAKFEKFKLLLPDSYQLIFPKPLPNGQMRKYVIVEFKKYNDRFPTFFILKLQALIRNSVFEDVPMIVKWAATNVIQDIKSGRVKEKKQITAKASA